MKIDISDGQICVSGWRSRFSAKAPEIERLAVMADRAYFRRIPIAELFKRKRTPHLRFIMIETTTSTVTLDAARDENFDLALKWLRENDWDIGAAVGEALETPLMRIFVSKLPEY